MNISDMILLAFANLFRTKLRTALTVLGVIIGIAALSSMVSLGIGMQKNLTDAFIENDLFTSYRVTTKNIDLEQISSGNFENIKDLLDKPQTALTDSIIEIINNIEGVQYAFADIQFPVQVVLEGYNTKINAQGLPATSGQYKPYTNLLAGSFFQTNDEKTVVVKWETLRKMGLVPRDKDNPVVFSREDSLKGFQVIDPDSIIGKELVIKSKTLNPLSLAISTMSGKLPDEKTAFREVETRLLICGILKKSNSFVDQRFRGGIYIPLETAGDIPKLGFSSIWDLFDEGKEDSYGSVYVRAKNIQDMETIRRDIEALGLHTFSIADQLEEIKRTFLIIDSLFGAIGSVALIIAALGIINTMLMSILERTREIGIMKAIGGSEREIKFIFFVEAGFIGFIGAIFGLVLGWLVTRVANIILNAQFPEEEIPVELFYFPWWLLAGATAFSILISLAAGLYPAIRAARIDPVKALRHD